MAMKEEILTRLKNPNQSFDANLAYGMKLWRSSSFYYMSKYEVIFEFFLDGLTGFMKDVSKLSPEEFAGRWQIVNEFLALSCSSNALPPRIIPKLRKVFSALTGGKHQVCSEVLLESFLIVAFDIKYKNFYKFDYLSYGMALDIVLSYYQKCLKQSFSKEREEKTVQRILDDIRIYVKSAGDDDKWQSAFTHSLPSLCQVILLLKSNGLDRQEDLLELFKQVYFHDGKGPQYNRVHDQSKKHLLMGYFDPAKLPIHVVALLIEGYLRAYREIKLDVLLFLKYILLHVFVDPEKSILSDVHQIFQLTNYVFHLLRKYFIKIDQKLVEDFDFTGIITIKLKEFLEKYGSSEAQLRDIFSLICTINEYNPLILEASIIDIVLRTMFIPKDPETLQTFQSMLVSTIGLYVKLNRSENFREELFSKLGDYLDDHDLSDRIKELRKNSKKRKSVAVAGTPGKRRKLSGGEEATEANSGEHEFFGLLFPKKQYELEKNVFRVHLQDQWQSLAFAWPDSDGRLSQAMLDYVKGLLTKRSFVYWRKMQDYLEEMLETIEEDQSEAELFKLEFSVCWLCYFFAGSTLIEQTNLFWDKLDKQFAEFDETMGKFGRLLINGNIQDARFFGSFLKLVYFYGNYRLLVHYYRPDSVETSQNHLVHQFLSESEWKQLEELIPSTEQPLYHRIHLQKIRVSHLVEEQTHDETEQQELVEKILAPEGFDQLRWLLQDRASNFWFLQLLSLDQRISVVDRLLSNSCFEEIGYIVTQLGDDHSLMEVVLVSTYKQIAGNILVNSKSSIAKKLSFDEIYVFDLEKTMGRVRKLLEKKAEKMDETISCEEPGQLRNLFNVLDQIRIDEIPEEHKTVLVGVNLLLFADLVSCGNDEIVALHRNIVSKQLTFGTAPNLLKYLDVETLITIFGPSSPLVVTLFRQTAIFLTEDAFERFKIIGKRFAEQSDGRFELVLLVFNCLQKNNANRRKLIPAEELSELISNYVGAIEEFIASKTAKKVRKAEPETFSNLLKGCSLIIRYKAVNKKELSEELRESFLQYLDQALKVDNSASTTLLTNGLQHKDFLKLDAERIELIVENRWSGFLSQLRSEIDANPDQIQGSDDSFDIDGYLQSQNVKIFVAFLTHNQPGAKLAERFDRLEKEAATDRNHNTRRFVLRVYSTFAKNAFVSGVSQDVEKAFVRSFGSIVANEILSLCVLKKFFDDMSCLEEILNCFTAVVANPKLTLVPSIMDNMLEFLGSINIKKYVVKDEEEKTFYRLHRLISDVLYLLMITRPNYVINRLPHYFYVYNGLVAAVVCYKEDRPVEQTLNSFEILTLSDLLLPLEKIMTLAGKKVETDLRILAPYVLMQIISSMIQSKRSTTLHEKVSRTVHNICYGLIEMYDKHSSGYILRTCDEASKNVYTEIVKGFRKYKSFRGKV